MRVSPVLPRVCRVRVLHVLRVNLDAFPPFSIPPPFFLFPHLFCAPARRPAPARPARGGARGGGVRAARYISYIVYRENRASSPHHATSVWMEVCV